MIEQITKVRDALKSAVPSVFHYTAFQCAPPYAVWMEETEGDSVHGDDGKTIQVIQGSIDYFTMTDLDPLVDKIQVGLAAQKIAYRLNSVQYEEETGMIHYEWIWEVG